LHISVHAIIAGFWKLWFNSNRRLD